MRELSLNILDIVQNSICAKSTLIEIHIKIDTTNNLMNICIYDNGCGMNDEQLKNVTDPFFTTRTTRKVGMGVSLFKMAAEMTGGNLKINSQVGVGTKLDATFNISHIDFTPLGDINQTISMLIRLNPNIDFFYIYRVDNIQFVIDTREIKNILDGVSINQPDVIKWIEDYIKEQNYNIFGGAIYENNC